MGIRHDNLRPQLCSCRPIQLGELWLHADDRVPMGMLARLEDLADSPAPASVAEPPQLCPRRTRDAELPLSLAPAVREQVRQVRGWMPAVEPEELPLYDIAVALDREISRRLAEAMRTELTGITVNETDLQEVQVSLYDQIAAAMRGERPNCECRPVHAWPDGPVIGYSSTCERHS